MKSMQPLQKIEKMPTPESGVVKTPELIPESTPEREAIRRAAEQASANQSAHAAAGTVEGAMPQPTIKDAELVAIETILEEGLEEFFLSLNAQQQRMFQATGEATAQTIKTLIERGKYRIKDIVDLIVRWLRSLPGINVFFLEQEAKIKADRIVARYRT